MKIYIGGLDWDIQEGQLRQLFEEFGTVSKAVIVQDLDTNRSRGFGFVEMPDEQALKAIINLNGSTLEGRILRVSVALPPRDRYRRDRYPEKS